MTFVVFAVHAIVCHHEVLTRNVKRACFFLYLTVPIVLFYLFILMGGGEILVSLFVIIWTSCFSRREQSEAEQQQGPVLCETAAERGL